jgi:hypothetical protein
MPKMREHVQWDILMTKLDIKYQTGSVTHRNKIRVLNLFAGETLLFDILPTNVYIHRNDTDLEIKADTHQDALELVNQMITRGHIFFHYILLDPPYAYRKSMEKYGGRMASNFRILKDQLLHLIPIGGRVMEFGYSTSGMSAKRGFEKLKIYNIEHGGAVHNTLAVLEERIN